MTGRRTRAAGRVARTVRPAGSWELAIERARESWERLTGQRDGPYSDVAAAAILGTAAVLWADVAAALGPDGLGEVDG